MDKFIAVVMLRQPISGIAVQPVYHVGPLNSAQVEDLERRVENSRYFIDEVVSLLTYQEFASFVL